MLHRLKGGGFGLRLKAALVRLRRTWQQLISDMWIDYIKNQAPPEPDDNFNVTNRDNDTSSPRPSDTCSLRPYGRHACTLPSSQSTPEAPPSSRLKAWGFLI